MQHRLLRDSRQQHDQSVWPTRVLPRDLRRRKRRVHGHRRLLRGRDLRDSFQYVRSQLHDGISVRERVLRSPIQHQLDRGLFRPYLLLRDDGGRTARQAIKV